MTHSLYDPRNFSKTSASSHPKVLHFQYGSSSDVFRYVLVERIPWHEINTSTRRKDGEPKSDIELAEICLKGKEDDRERDAEVTGLQGDVCNGTRAKGLGLLKKFHKTKPKSKSVRQPKKNRPSNGNEE